VIEAEARELIADGAVEISLIGQDTTSYGIGDDSIEGGLAGLLRRLDAIPGIGWLRLMYVYPSVMTDDIIDAVAECEHVCKYIDIPLQHINDRMLKAMYRRVDRETTVRLLERIRARIPGVSIRTTLIAGFPGETEAEFQELRQFVEDFKFDALGVFPYSLEPDTPAGRMKHQIADEVKADRVDRLMRTQQKVAFERAGQRVGTAFDVLVDTVERDGSSVLARHQGQAPGVDSVTRVEGCAVAAGSFLPVRCIDSDGYDLVARPVDVSLPVIGA
jgi:ribosomal protein S12 methylthiotransferase